MSISFISLILGLIFLRVLIWVSGGIIGGTITSIFLWQQKGINIQPVKMLIGWLGAFSLGGLVFIFCPLLFEVILSFILDDSYLQIFEVIPMFLTLCITGAIIGSIGSKHTLKNFADE